ncbi:TPA: alanine-zipper protein [Enterococcus faecium]
MADKNIQMEDKEHNRLMPVTIAKNVLYNDSNLGLVVIDIENNTNEAKQTAQQAKETADGLSTDITTANATANQALTNASTAQQTAEQAKATADGISEVATTAKNTADSAQQNTTDLAVRVSSLENTAIQYSVLP